MPMPNRAGRFRGPIIDAGVDNTGQNNLATVIIKHALDEELRNGEWIDIRHEYFEFTTYNYIEKKDGTLNEFVVKSIKEAIGWNGSDLNWFATGEFHPCQITLEYEDYNGKTSLKMQWMNPYDSTAGGGVTKADDGTLRDINNRLGSKLRALSGGTPVATPKPAGAPAAPPPARQNLPPMETRSITPSYKQADAWTAFLSAGKRDGHEQGVIDSTWHEAVGMFNKPEIEITESEWRQIGAGGPTEILNAQVGANQLPF